MKTPVVADSPDFDVLMECTGEHVDGVDAETGKMMAPGRWPHTSRTVGSTVVLGEVDTTTTSCAEKEELLCSVGSRCSQLTHLPRA